jgi:hypothetical protein
MFVLKSSSEKNYVYRCIEFSRMYLCDRVELMAPLGIIVVLTIGLVCKASVNFTFGFFQVNCVFNAIWYESKEDL